MFNLNWITITRSDNNSTGERGQALVEYSLLLGLLILGAVVGVAATGTVLSGAIDQVQTAVTTIADAQPEPAMTNLQREVNKLLERIQRFYNERGRWPRGWGDYAYTDIGLSPTDYANPIDGVYIGPSGDKVSIGLKPGNKSVKVYVTDLNGNVRQLYSGWKIWCLPGGSCYYHTVAPGNEIDLASLVVVDTTSAVTK